MPHALSAPSVSLTETYSGYALIQDVSPESDATLRLERAMRATAALCLGFLLALWLWPGSQWAGETLTLKLAFSAILLMLAGFLIRNTYGKARFECRVDLIHCELVQIARGGGAGTRRLMRVSLSEIDSLFIRENPDLPETAGLYMRLDGVAEPALLGIGPVEHLEPIQQRLSGDLVKARGMAQPTAASEESPTAGLLQPA